MERRRFSIGALASWTVGVILVVALGIFLVVGLRMGLVSGRRRMVNNNRALLSLSTDLMFDPLYDVDVWSLKGMLDEFVGEADIVRAVVRDTTGESVAEATVEEDGPTLEEQINRELAAQALAQGDIVERESEGYLVLCGPIATGAEQLGTLEIIVDLGPFQSSFTPMILSMTFTSVAVIVGGILTAVLLARRATSSLNALVAAADDIGRGNLDTSVPISGPSETAALGRALDRMRIALKDLYGDLERQAAAQKRRAKHLQVAAEVAHRAAAELDTSVLLQRVAALIDERFEFSRQGIFLVDASGEWVVLQAASGKAVRQTLDSDFRLRVGQEGAVGYVAETGEAYVMQDVRDDPFYVSDTKSVDIRSEVALPLRARGEVIGVLDVQSTEVGAFAEGDVAALRTLADQVALAISNARLFQQAQESLEKAQRAYGELSREAWGDIMQAQADQGYYCDAAGVFAAADRPDERDDEDLPEFSIPLVVRDQVVGTVKAHKPGDSERWTEEEIALMESLTERLSVALESARLHERVQRRAARERMTREITDAIRSAVTVDEAVQRAMRELNQALETTEIVARVGTRREILSGQGGDGNE